MTATSASVSRAAAVRPWEVAASSVSTRASATGHLQGDRCDRPCRLVAAPGADAAGAVAAGEPRSERLVGLRDGVPVVARARALLHQLTDVAEAEVVPLHLLDLGGELLRGAEVEPGGAGDLVVEDDVPADDRGARAH